MNEDRTCPGIHPLVLTPVSSLHEGKIRRYGVYDTTQEAGEQLDQILAPHGRSSAELLHELGTAVERMGARTPWVTIVLPRQYRLTGHFLSIRESVEQLSLSFYERWSGRPEEYLEVGILTIWTREGLRALAKKCPFLWGAWTGLSDLPESNSWLVFAPEPEIHWLADRSAVDECVHYHLRCLERRRCSVTQSGDFPVEDQGGESCHLGN